MIYLIQKLTTEHLKGMVEMTTLKNWMIGEMEMELSNMIGNTTYGCDLGYGIFETANVDGSYTYSTHKAKEWIREYFDELGDVVEEIQFNLGENSVANCFNEPEKFMVQIMLESSSSLIAQCKTVEENWNNEIELTEETIKQIIEELREQRD